MAKTNSIFYLDLPEGWKETTVYTFEGPNDSGLQHNLVLVIDPKPSDEMDLKGYVKAQIDNSLQYMSGFEMVSEQELQASDGAQAYLICYKHVPAPEKVLFQKQLYIMENKALCIFTSSYTKKTLQTVAYEVQEIIKSFKLFDEGTIREIVQR